MNKHDKNEIKKLLEFKKWYLWFKNLSKEEKEKYKMERWKTD